MMNDRVGRELLDALERTSHAPTQSGARALAVERILAAHLSTEAGVSEAEVPNAVGLAGRVDLVIRRSAAPLLGVEVKVLSGTSFANNINNRTADLLAQSVEFRRLYHGEVALAAILIVTDAGSSGRHAITTERLRTVAQRLLRRSGERAGFDSVLWGLADGEFRWLSFHSGTDDRTNAEKEIASGEDALRRVVLHAPIELSHRTSSDRREPGASPRIMLVADEWTSGHGGLSTVNRELAVALAAAGAEATVFVPHASESDIQSASATNVSIVSAARVPGLSPREQLLLRPVFSDAGWVPDVIIGHGRTLGPYAAAQQQQFFERARRVHIVHTDAEQLEAAKEHHHGRSLMRTAEERRLLERSLARSADLVMGIGPLLTETIRDELLGPGEQPEAIMLMPGLRSAAFDASSAYPPVKNRILIVGRADDFHSKGIRVAADALLRLASRWPQDRPHRPFLVLRGVPDDAADEVKGKLDSILEGYVECYLRPYSDSEDELIQDLSQARVVLMPSRHEGFGLAAYEAIASGVPTLVSAESGLAQYIRENHIDTSPTSILPTRNSLNTVAADVWADAIQHVLDEPEGARNQARRLRQKIAARESWSQAARVLLAALERQEG